MIALDRLRDAWHAAGLNWQDTSGTTASAQAPGHSPADKSVRITQIDGQVLMYCHAGENTADVLEQVGLATADLFDSPQGVTYEYSDGRTVHRSPNKRFRQAGNTDGKALYRVENLPEGKDLQVFVVEGEKDVHALESVGEYAVTSGGANTARNRDWSPLQDRHVTIVADDDQPGHKYAEQVAAELENIAASVTVVAAKSGKDAADHIAAGHKITEFQKIETKPTQKNTNPLSFIKTGDWLDDQDYPPLKFAVPGLIPEGFGLLTGPPKIGKSWAVLGIALSIAVGGKAFGRIAVGKPRPVLYLALEDGERRLQSRARKLLHDEPIPANFNFVTAVPPMLVMDVINAWMSANGDRDPLVILDTLGRVMPPARPGESAYDRDYRIGVELKSVSDSHAGSTFIVVHHVRKQAGEDWMDSTSGTNGLNGAADYTINLSRKRNEETGLIRVTGRDAFEGEYSVTVSDGSWTIDGDSLEAAAKAAEQARDTQNLGVDSERILKFINKQTTPVAAKYVADTLEIDRARDYLLRLVKSERIKKAGRGLYAPLHLTVASVATVANDGDPEPNATHDTHATPDARREVLGALSATYGLDARTIAGSVSPRYRDQVPAILDQFVAEGIATFDGTKYLLATNAQEAA